MKTELDAQLLTIYVNSNDRWHGRPLYSAIVQLCLDRGIAGATVIRCLEGFGSHHRLHTPRLLELSENLPVRIEIIDLPGKIGALLPELDPMIGEGLLTVRDVHVVRYQAGPTA